MLSWNEDWEQLFVGVEREVQGFYSEDQKKGLSVVMS